MRIQEALLATGAARAAGAAAAGGVGGLLLRDTVRQPDGLRETDPPRVVETIPAPAGPEALEYHMEVDLPFDPPAPHAEEQPVYIPVLLPVEETPEGSGREYFPAVLPGEGLAPKFGAGPDSRPEPEAAPGRSSGFGYDYGSDSDTDTGPGLNPGPVPDENTPPRPDPAPAPAPDSTPDPAPDSPEPTPSVDDFCQPNHEFGAYLGRNEEGVHEFDVYLLTNREIWLYPLEEGRYYTREDISDETQVGLYSDYTYGKEPGTSEVRYYVSRTLEGPFGLKVIAHVTVEPEQTITPDYDWSAYEGTRNAAAYFRRTFVEGNYEVETPFQPG